MKRHRRPPRQRRRTKGRRPQQRTSSAVAVNSDRPKLRLCSWFRSRKTGPKPARFTVSLEKLDLQAVENLPAVFSYFPEISSHLDWISLRSMNATSSPRRLLRSQHLFGDNYVFLKDEESEADRLPENQAKQLEFSLARIIRNKPRRLISFSQLGSSHALAIAHICELFGFKSEAYILRDKLHHGIADELVELKDMGTKLFFCPTEKAMNLARSFRSYLYKWTSSVQLPFEGLCTEACFGYISSAFEIKELIDSGELPEIDFLVLPVETGAALAGFEIGRQLAGIENMKIIGVQTRCIKSFSQENLVAMANLAIDRLNQILSTKKLRRLQLSDFEILTDYSESSNFISDEEIGRWKNRFLELEEVMLQDSRALFALTDIIVRKSLSSKKILFWNSHLRSRISIDNPKSFERLPSILRRWKKTG